MSLNILVVDDSDVIRAMIRRTLSLSGVDVGTVYEAAHGREALDVLAEEWVDLVLADINMPVMTGAEMIERMHRNADMRDVPIIVVSTEGATERVDELMALGVAAWVRKPFTPEEIRRTILDVIASWAPPLEVGAIDQVLASVLETFAFVVPDLIDVPDVPAVSGELMSAAINFSGAASGTMSVCAPAALCVELAANILGIDEDDVDAVMKGADTLGEVVNIAAGHLATAVDPTAKTNLHPPVVSRIDEAEWMRAVESSASRCYLVEDRPVVVTVGLRKSASQA